MNESCSCQCPECRHAPDCYPYDLGGGCTFPHPHCRTCRRETGDPV